MKRPFHGIRPSDDLAASYDAVVIGTGIGGLICANRLAQGGLRVLLVEQHAVVGGYCSTFRRHGFTFDAASHFYPLLGNPRTLTGKILRELDVDIAWEEIDPPDQFHFPDGGRFAVPVRFDAYVEKLKREFPDEVAGIDAYFQAVEKLYVLGMLEYFRGVSTSRLDPYRDMTLDAAIKRHIQSDKLRLLLAADSPHWGSPPSRTSFVFDAMLRMSYFLGNYYPRGGSQVLADTLAARFEQLGGHVLLKTMVRRILVEDGAVTGVELETGPLKSRLRATVRAGAVVSNGDLRRTIEQMIGVDHVPPEYVARLRELRPTLACYLSHIGVMGIADDVLRDAHGYHWRGWDANRLDSLRFKIFVPTLYDASLAPPGGHVVVIQKVLDASHDATADAPYDATTDWSERKQVFERTVNEDLEQVLPGFGRHVVVQLSATADTSRRFTLNYEGAMLGWEMSPDQLGERRPDIAGPLQNLYLVGHWTRPGGGITPVVISAETAARRILAERPSG